MRIGLDVSAALAGDSGIKFYVIELVNELSRVGADHEFILCSAFWKNPSRLDALPFVRRPNVSIDHLRMPQQLLFPADEYLHAGIQDRWLRGLRLDLFHGLGNIIPPTSIPTVLTIHHVGGVLDRPGLWANFYFFALVERAVRRADAIIAVSSYSRAEVIKYYGLPEKKVTAVLEGGPTSAFQPAPPGFKPLLNEPYILYVGAFVERKNLASLVRAYGRIRKTGRHPHKLVLAGSKGRYFAELSRIVAEERLTGDVRFMDRLNRDDIVRLYQGASMLAFPSLLEGFGFPVLEAMACGVPVVASTSGAIPEVAANAAELVDAKDIQALENSMVKVLEDRTLAQELVARGRRRVNDLSWNRTAKETLAVYSKVAKGLS